MYYMFHFLNRKAPAATEGGQGKCQSFSSGCAEISPLLQQLPGQPRFWEQAELMGSFLEGVTESTAPALTVQMLGTHLFLCHINWKNTNPLGLHIQDKFCTGTKTGGLCSFLQILICGDAQVVGLIHFSGEL